MPDPAQLLNALVADNATAPLVTFYDDTPGPTAGERIELSRRVVQNWVAKAANALQEGMDVHSGSVVLLDLPAPHWRTFYWALATWSVGATLTLDSDEGADVLITHDPQGPLVDDADEVIAVALPALARDFGADLRSGVMDEAHELSSYGDSFTPWDDPDPDRIALVAGGERVSYADLVPAPTWPSGTRVLIRENSVPLCLQQMLQVVAAGGSMVLVRGGSEPPDAQRLRAEVVDLVAPGAPGTAE